jgi:hypothetical protein
LRKQLDRKQGNFDYPQTLAREGRTLGDKAAKTRRICSPHARKQTTRTVPISSGLRPNASPERLLENPNGHSVGTQLSCPCICSRRPRTQDLGRNHGEEEARRHYRNTNGSPSSRARPIHSVAACRQRKYRCDRSRRCLVRVLPSLENCRATMAKPVAHIREA